MLLKSFLGDLGKQYKLPTPLARHMSGLALQGLRKQGFKVSQIIEILNKSKNWVMKWSVYGKTGEFSKVVFTGSHFNIRESADDMKRCHDCLMLSS